MNLWVAQDMLAWHGCQFVLLTSKRQTPFLLAGGRFYCTKVHIIKVSVIRHPHPKFRSKYEHVGAGLIPVYIDWMFWYVLARCWFGLFETPHSECIEAVGAWSWCSGLSVFGFRLWLSNLDCFLLLGWIKCATDRGRGCAVTLWVELSASCCLYLVKTGGDLISPGRHKLDRPTCCPDLLLIFLLTFKGRERKICAGKSERKKKTSIEF